MPNLNKPIKRPWVPDKNRMEQRTFRDKRYDSVMWRKLRFQALVKHPLCKRCEAEGLTRQATVYDHIIPVRLLLPYTIHPDPFWHSNHQGLCDDCHNHKSAKEAHYKDAVKYFAEQLNIKEKNKTKWIIDCIRGRAV